MGEKVVFNHVNDEVLEYALLVSDYFFVQIINGVDLYPWSFKMRALNCEINTISAFNGFAIATAIPQPWKADLEFLSAFSVYFRRIKIRSIVCFGLWEVSLTCFLWANHSSGYGELIKNKTAALINVKTRILKAHGDMFGALIVLIVSTPFTYTTRLGSCDLSAPTTPTFKNPATCNATQ